MGTLNHVPDEIHAVYEAVAKDKDVVLVHVLVLSLEEPRASGGGKKCLNFFFIHNFENLNINKYAERYKILLRWTNIRKGTAERTA